MPVAKPKSPGKSARKRRVILAATVSIAVLAGGAAWGFTRTPNGGGNPVTALVAAFQPLRPTNILLIGNNARNPKGPLDIGTGGGQADIMMLAHVDPRQHTVELISIPRDMMFAMPHDNITIPKIKSLFFIGAQMTPNQAAQRTVQGVEQFTGLRINDWIVTDFQGFADAINAVGGVRLDVPGRIVDPLHSGANLYPGWQTLDGSQALAYIRVRQNTASSVATNDFERDDAQAQVLQALQQKLLSGSNDMAHIGSLMSTWMKDVATNMSVDQLVRIAKAARGAKVTHINLANVGDSMDVMGTPLPGINQQNYLTGAYYDVIDPSQVTRMLKPLGSTGASTGVSLPAPSQVQVDVYASSAYANLLQRAGFQVHVMGGSSGQYPVTIDYPTGELGAGLQVGRTLGTGNSIVQQGASGNAVVVYGP